MRFYCIFLFFLLNFLSFAEPIFADQKCPNELEISKIDETKLPSDLITSVEEAIRLRFKLTSAPDDSTLVRLFENSMAQLRLAFQQSGFNNREFDQYYVEKTAALSQALSSKQAKNKNLALKKQKLVDYQKKRSINPLFGRTPQVAKAIKKELRSTDWNNEPITWDELQEIKVLHLGNEGITQLKEDDFEGLINLKQLDLSRNDLTTLPVNIFKPLKHLYELHLSHNDLEELPEMIFSKNKKLSILNLSYNDLKDLPVSIFKALTNLTELNLSNNDLTSLPQGIYNGLKSLKTLLINANLFKDLPRELFWKQGLDSLEEINVTGNPLQRDPRKSFKRIGHIRKLKTDRDPYMTRWIEITVRTDFHF